MAIRHKTLILDAPPPSGLAAFDPADTHGLGHESAVERLDKAREQLAALQKRIKASETWSVLAIFQGMDAAGKDSTIAHVFSGLDPGGVQVTAFKRPSAEELAHDALWREHRAVPRAGQFGVFNRSHYETVLVPRAQKDLAPARRRPAALTGPGTWLGQLDDIVNFERMLARNGVVICKFFLHISREEQRRRLLERLDDPHKAWKFEPSDLAARKHWDAYQAAYEEAIAATASPFAPWAIIPADSKPAARALVAEILVDRLSSLEIEIATPQPAMLAAARAELRATRKD